MLKQKKRCTQCTRWFLPIEKKILNGKVKTYKTCLKCRLRRRKEKEKNKEKYKKYGKEYREKNKEYYKEYYQGLKNNNYYQGYRADNIERIRKIERDFQRKKRLCPEYRKKDAERGLAWHHKKYKKDASYRLRCCMGSQIRQALKSNKNGRHWESLTGYTLGDLKKHLEKKFKQGMTWENYGQWHIDHIIPKSVFNYSKPEHPDFQRCWALSNLQPLWAKENILKKDNLVKHFQPQLQLGFD